MTYELECGHCGYQFTLDGKSLSRTVKCTVCGGVLTVAVAVPKTPDPPRVAPPPPPPVPSLPPAPSPKPVRREPTEADPEVRAARLAEPWRSIRKGLNTARTATDFALAPYLCLLTVGLVVAPFVSAPDQHGVARLLGLIAVAHLLPAAIHLTAQASCVNVPRAYGAPYANASLWVLGLALFLLIALESPRSAVSAGVFAVLGVASLVLWLAFLTRLAGRLSDRVLDTELRAFTTWLWRGVLLAALLLCIAYFAENAQSRMFAWIGFAGAGAIGFVLLCGYSALLRVMTEAIDRHAPLASGR